MTRVTAEHLKKVLMKVILALEDALDHPLEHRRGNPFGWARRMVSWFKKKHAQLGMGMPSDVLEVFLDLDELNAFHS